MENRLGFDGVSGKHKPDDLKCDVIENRADRPNEEHESRQAADLPLARALHVFLVDIVEGNRRLRNIIKQVLDKDLNRQHRQERQEDTRSEYAEHVSKIGTGSHSYVFDDVAEGLAAFEDASAQNQQVLF